MMLFAQGWKTQPDGTKVVSAITISPCTNGMSGWQVHVGCYDPARGQTIQNATWTFKAAAADVRTLLQHPVLTEMLTWTDEAGPRDLKAAIERVETLLKDIAARLPCQS